MKTAWMGVLMGLGCVSASAAFNCYLTVAKDNCWKNYNASVSVIDASSGKILQTVKVASQHDWQRLPFTCQPGQNLNFQSSFSPSIWQGDKGVVYPAKKYKLLPKEPAVGQTAWEVSICYSHDFSGVPIPPESNGNCVCDMKSIPALEVR
jgi:hypothetical protein